MASKQQAFAYFFIFQQTDEGSKEIERATSLVKKYSDMTGNVFIFDPWVSHNMNSFYLPFSQGWKPQKKWKIKNRGGKTGK